MFKSRFALHPFDQLPLVLTVNVNSQGYLCNCISTHLFFFSVVSPRNHISPPPSLPLRSTTFLHPTHQFLSAANLTSAPLPPFTSFFHPSTIRPSSQPIHFHPPPTSHLLTLSQLPTHLHIHPRMQPSSLLQTTAHILPSQPTSSPSPTQPPNSASVFSARNHHRPPFPPSTTTTHQHSHPSPPFIPQHSFTTVLHTPSTALTFHSIPPTSPIILSTHLSQQPAVAPPNSQPFPPLSFPLCVYLIA